MQALWKELCFDNQSYTTREKTHWREAIQVWYLREKVFSRLQLENPFKDPYWRKTIRLLIPKLLQKIHLKLKPHSPRKNPSSQRQPYRWSINLRLLQRFRSPLKPSSRYGLWFRNGRWWGRNIAWLRWRKFSKQFNRNSTISNPSNHFQYDEVRAELSAKSTSLTLSDF